MKLLAKFFGSLKGVEEAAKNMKLAEHNLERVREGGHAGEAYLANLGKKSRGWAESHAERESVAREKGHTEQDISDATERGLRSGWKNRYDNEIILRDRPHEK